MSTYDPYCYTDFQKLSSAYRQWLTAVGAVNATVFALVLILTYKNIFINNENYATLISSLFVGIFTCFIGSLLMSETESVSKNKEAYHLFMIASINIHIAAILFFSSAMYLAISYEDLLGSYNIPLVIFFMFLFAGLSSLLWMLSMILNSWKRIKSEPATHKKLASWLIIGAVAITTIYLLIGFFLNAKTLFPIPFTLCALSSITSIVTFVIVSEFVMEKEKPSNLALPISIMMYAVGVSLPLVSVMWLAWGIIQLRDIKRDFEFSPHEAGQLIFQRKISDRRSAFAEFFQIKRVKLK